MPKGKAEGLFYAPSPQPSASVEATQVWCLREFQRIADVLREGGAQSLRLDILQAVPEKLFEGMAAYFAAGVVGANKGMYQYDGTSWKPL